jgi:hypothetical protein
VVSHFFACSNAPDIFEGMEPHPARQGWGKKQLSNAGVMMDPGDSADASGKVDEEISLVRIKRKKC